uniref:PC-esterase domain-containing protein 1B n=1 Tax=Castor canadensis TaxID=51338 RepID=A0A8C0ZYF7_CASCN
METFPKCPKGRSCLFRRLGQVLPESCLLVWNTAMPVAEIVSGGFLRPARRACPAHLREDVMEANFYSSVAAARHGFDVLDLHFHFRHAGQHRQRDGVHWDERAHRHLTQLLLAHMADAWGVALPGRERVPLEKAPSLSHPLLDSPHHFRDKYHFNASCVTASSVLHALRKDCSPTASLLGFCACCLISLHLSSHSLLESLTAFECTVLYHLRRGYIDLSGVCSKVSGIKSQ